MFWGELRKMLLADQQVLVLVKGEDRDVQGREAISLWE